MKYPISFIKFLDGCTPLESISVTVLNKRTDLFALLITSSFFENLPAS